jgi:exonuclease SbcC
MQITLRKLNLINFKGIRSLVISFDKTTSIFGENASGKTSVFDAFTWLLFGKDSQDRKDFEVKTLDADNRAIPQIEHEVSADLQCDNQVITLRRVLRETWVKKRGNTTAEFTGNETLYYWNDVPLKQSEYQAKVSAMVDENLFKLITNPLYFNNVMKWQERRQVLFSMAPALNDEQILDTIATVSNKQQLMDITLMLNMGKSLVEYKKELGSKKKKLKDELQFIPSRIDEATRSMPEVRDWKGIEMNIAAIENEILTLALSKEDQTKALSKQNEVVLQKQNELNGLKQRLQLIQHSQVREKGKQVQEVNDKIEDLKHSASVCISAIDRYKTKLQQAQSEVERLNKTNFDLRNKWNTANQSEVVISDSDTACPSCGEPLKDHENIVATITKNFNESKMRRLAAITAEGIANKTRLDEIAKEVTSYHRAIEDNEKQHASIQGDLTMLHETVNIFSTSTLPVTTEMEELEKQINAFVIPANAPVDFSEVNATIKGYQDELSKLQAQLNNRDQLMRLNARIDELKAQERTMAQELADLENSEFVIDAFNKKKIDLMVESVNKKFTYIQFRLFKEQINGGVDECCDALINGVPYQDANNAAKINAGLDIINALCAHNDVYAPIFIDNKESVNALIPVRSQIVNLIVSLDKTLRVEGNKAQAA